MKSRGISHSIYYDNFIILLGSKGQANQPENFENIFVVIYLPNFIYLPCLTNVIVIYNFLLKSGSSLGNRKQ